MMRLKTNVMLAVVPLALLTAACDPAGPGTFSCGILNDNENVYLLDTPGPGELYVAVDTINAFTTFDPAVEVIEMAAIPEVPRDAVGTRLGSFDDSFDCTFPPPSFSCPEGVVSIGTAPIAIVVRRVSSCGGDSGNYDLFVDVNGAPAVVTYLGSRR